MNTSPLITIITACYNGEKFLDDFFDSLLVQSYKNYELIIVNDGSVDDSESIILKYKKIFKDRGNEFVYLKRENGGQLRAFNDGLKKIRGEYLAWLDVDDHIHIDYLEKKLQCMMENKDVDILISRCQIFNIKDKTKVVGEAWKREFKSKEELIKRFILGIDAGYMPGAFFLRTTSFLNVYPEKELFSDIKAGVAVPLVFPFVYKGKALYLSESLYDYYLHPNNQHSIYAKQQYSDIVALYNGVIKGMNLSEKECEEIMKLVTNHSNRLLLSVAFREQDVHTFDQLKQVLICNKYFGFKDKIKDIILHNKVLRNFYFKKLKS